MARFLFNQLHNVEMIVENGKPSGGSVMETLEWMKALNELGHEVCQVKLTNDHRIQKSEYDWINLVPVFDGSKGIKWIRWFYYRFPKYLSVCKQEEINFIYESIPGWQSVFFNMICKRLNMGYILRIASDVMVKEVILKRKINFYRIMLFYSFKQADIILGQNDYQTNVLKQRFPQKNIFKVYNPIRISNNFEKRIKRFSGYVAWVANFRFVKNFNLLYKIASNNSEFQFKIAGEPLFPLDSETAYYYEKLKELNNVDFVGSISREKIFEFFFEARYLLNTSRFEGFSNTFIESMMVGTPVLTTSAVNPDGIIEKFKLGFIYKDELDIENILKNTTEKDYLEISKNCIQYVENNHDHLQLGKNLLKFVNIPVATNIKDRR